MNEVAILLRAIKKDTVEGCDELIRSECQDVGRCERLIGIARSFRDSLDVSLLSEQELENQLNVALQSGIELEATAAAESRSNHSQPLPQSEPHTTRAIGPDSEGIVIAGKFVLQQKSAKAGWGKFGAQSKRNPSNARSL